MKQITMDWEEYQDEKQEEKTEAILNHMENLYEYLASLSVLINEKKKYYSGDDLECRKKLLRETKNNLTYEKYLNELAHFINIRMGYHPS